MSLKVNLAPVILALSTMFNAALAFAQITETPNQQIIAAANLPAPVETNLSETEINKESTEENEIDANIAELPPVENPDDINDVPARMVNIELNQAEGASYYEVHVVPAQKRWSEPYKFVVDNQSPFVRLRLTPGKYSVRTRSLSDKKMPGRWGEFKQFWVQFRSPSQIYPGPKAVIEPKTKGTESIIFEWPKVKSARAYLFMLKDKSGKVLKLAQTKQTWIKAEVGVDSKYKWSITPMSHLNEYQVLLRRQNLLTFNSFEILKPGEGARGTLIQVSAMKKVVKYQYEVVKITKQNEVSAPSFFESYDPETRLRLPPGEYEFRTRGVYGDNTQTEWSPPSRFFVKTFPPAKQSPVNNAEIEPTDDINAKVTLNWKSDPEVATYEVLVYDQKDHIIVREKTADNSITLSLPHDSKYKWQVRGFTSSREPASEPPPPGKDAAEFSISEYIKLDLSPAEEPSQYYAWGKYIVSVLQYRGENYDNNAIVKQSLFGGEGEAGLGYWSRKRGLGLLGSGSWAGFKFRNKYYTYENVGVHVGYRKLMPNGDRLRTWFGISYQEIPEILTNPFTTAVDFSKLKSLGPQLQFSYMHSLDKNFGWHVFASAYRGVKDLGTPNGLPQSSISAYRLGIYGTYSGYEQYKMMAGYMFKYDHASYGTTDVSGINNSAVTTGHYLSFILEFALEKPEK